MQVTLYQVAASREQQDEQRLFLTKRKEDTTPLQADPYANYIQGTHY
jgi:hypothetical protein